MLSQDGKRFKVGTGFRDVERRFLMEHKDDIIKNDSWIEVRFDPQEIERAGVHAPVYEKVHSGKSSGPILEMGMYEYANGDKNAIYAMKTSAGWSR